MKSTLKIKGMSCDHCVKFVTGALENIPGVTKAKVSLKTSSAEVEHADQVREDDLKAAVTEAGYEVVA
jgi:copper ion binding protein